MLYELKKIKQMRRKLGITQTQLAKSANVSQSLITKIERGAIEPSYSTVRRIFIILEEGLAETQKDINAKTIYTKNIIFVKSKDTIDEAIKLMKKFAISQIPVVKDNIIVGSISEETFIRNYNKIKTAKLQIEQIMDEPFPILPENTHIALIKDILKSYPAVIIVKKGKPTGIITKADLLKKL